MTAPGPERMSLANTQLNELPQWAPMMGPVVSGAAKPAPGPARDPIEAVAEQLAARCQGGCQESFGRLVELYHERIFNFLLRLTGQRQDAEDLTQETFVKAYRGIQRYRLTYAFSAWLFTIARRTAASHWRAAKRFEPLPGEEELAAAVPDPAAESAQLDDRTSLWHQARQLPPKQFEALWLRYGEGFSIAEIARIMRTNQIHVKVLLHRGRGQLAKRLDKKMWRDG